MTIAKSFEFELRYDLRNPRRWFRRWDVLYQNFLDQVQWADENGFDVIDLNEHHFSEDGYLPAPVTMAAAVAARTKRVKIRLAVVILPLKHPVQLAEELAVVDNISAGRLELCVGAGYREDEFNGFGISIKERGSRMDEGIEIIRRCWEEDEFSFHGRHWQLTNVRATPKPFRRPRPPIVVGGSSVAAATRAARLGDGFFPNNMELLKPWREEMVRLGKDPEAALGLTAREPIGASSFTFVANDPQATWQTIAEHVLYTHNSYTSWTSQKGIRPDIGNVATAEDLLKTDAYGIFTPEQILNQAERAISLGRHAKLRLQPMMSGIPQEVGQKSLEIVAKEVIPRVHRMTARAS